MFSHVHVGVSDLARAFHFYAPLLRALGLELKFREDHWAGWKSPSADRPLFIIGRPFDGRDASAGNGQMIAFLAPDRKTVRDVHALALQLGARDEGAPGLRPHYHAHYYGAYFRDLDGNKICVCCHTAEH